MSDTPLLELSHISKHYGGVCALDNVSFSVRHGEAHCLIGENGSGKSTLIKIISGVTRPDAGGTISFDGKTQSHLTPAGSIALGVQVIYQDHALFPHLTVAENIAFGLQSREMIASQRRNRQRAREIMERLRIKIDPLALVEDLPVSARQLIAISRAVAANGRFLIMDEPTASLTVREVERLFAVVDELRRDGVSVLFVSHRLNEVREIAERVTVLRDGRNLGTFPAAEIGDGELATLMTGRSFTYEARPEPVDPPPLFTVENLTRKGEFEDISFTVHEGEVLGILGPLGAGRTELALSLFGITSPQGGSMHLCGEPYRPRSNSEALEAGVSYLPEDRLTLGLVLQQSIHRNMTLSVLDRMAGIGGFVNRNRLDELVERLVRELKIKVSDVGLAVGTLSGGNQQRVALARLIATRPRLLILDCPTVGVDIAAKDAIYEIIHGLAAEGLAVVLISDEESEALQQAHRIVTMRDGRITGEYRPRQTTELEMRQVLYG